MKNNSNVLCGLVIMLAAVIYFPVQAQQKSDSYRASFSGEWKSKESIAMGGNIVCCYNAGDRMLAKTMKIADHASFLTIEASSSFPGEALVTSQERLTFDGKQSKIDHGAGRGKVYAVRLSADGQTMTVNSIVRLTVPTPYHIEVRKKAVTYITEVWKLSNDGKSISVQTKARSGLLGRDRERSWTTVFEKTSWYSKFL